MRFQKKLLRIGVMLIITLISVNSVMAGYNRNKAAKYAEKYWNKRNPAYKYYKGVNCANYVSQCLIAGGLTLKKGPGCNTNKCIPFCDNLHKHLVKHQKVNYKRLYKGYPTSFTKGDVVQFGNSRDRWKHAAINVVTGAPRLNANTSNRHKVKVSFFYPGSYASSADFYHFKTTSTVKRPSNDNCSGAKKLKVNGSSIVGTVKNATKSYGPNKCGGCSCKSKDDYDVYYYFTATSKTHTVILSNYASNFDAVLELRSACGYGKNISCYDPKGVPSKISKTWYNLKVGKRYYIRVFEYNYKKSPPRSPKFRIRVKSGRGSSAANTAIQEDIYLSQQSVSKTAIIAGERVDVAVDQNYTGSLTTTQKVYVHYYLSTDEKLSDSDVLLSSDNYSSLSTNKTVETESETLTIPSETTPGTYYILFVGDATNVIKESNESNGIQNMKISVVKNNNMPEDITISNTNVNPESVKPGASIKVSATQNYSGSKLNTELPDIMLSYYLSTDDKLSSDDISLGESISGLGSDNPSNNESASVIIPNETSSGDYYILFAADNGQNLAESNEENNSSSYKITVVEKSDSNNDDSDKSEDDNDTEIETTAINEVEVDNTSLMEQISLYPNPVNDILNVEISNGANIKKVIITNHLGKQAMILESLNNKQINVSDLSEGIYFVKFISDNNEVATYRVVKY
jgi:hypothetical protein